MGRWRWLAAVAVALVAIVVVGVAVANRQAARRPARVVDPRGDVFGSAPSHVVPALDVVGAAISGGDGGYRVVIQLAQPLDRAAIAETAVVYAVRLESATASYMARSTVSSRRTEATVADSRARERPFVLEPPEVSGDRVVVEIPRKAVGRLGPVFSWGVIADAGGSQDTAPSDLAARYPG